MWKQKIHKILSFLLIFSLMFSFTFQIPLELFLGSRAYALEKEFVNLVSIVVDEDTYDEVRTKLVRYSRDIQGVLENTRVVILPTPVDASVIDIASLGESLYLDGYNSLSDVEYESRLIGTVFVGKIPLPTVFDGGDSSQTMLPYIDFVDKSYIYNHESKKYEKNDAADTKLSPEIWHGVISPNTGNEGDDIEAIKDFFDKNHDFYSGQGVFEQEKGIIDGLFTPAEDDYEPYVFYYDQFRENEALQYQNYIGYESYLENIEDITYNRYSKELAEKVSEKILGVQNADIADLLREAGSDLDITNYDNSPDSESSSDVLTRYITNTSTKKLLEVFNGSTLGEMRKQIYNAGRYNDIGGEVNVDMPPFLISVLDQVSSEIVKNVNTSLENQIIELVENGLSRNIEIPVAKKVSCGISYENFYYGLGARGVTNASECSIYRGSTENGGQLVEANRGRNLDFIQNDTELCSVNLRVSESTGKITAGVQSMWGGNTPINLAGSQGEGNFGLNLGNHTPSESYISLFDIKGSSRIEDEEYNPSPIDCFESGVYMQTESKERKDHTYTVETSSGDSREVTHSYCATKYVITVPENGQIDPSEHIDYYYSLGHDDGHKYLPLEDKEDSWTRFCSEEETTSYSINGNLGDATETKYISSHMLHTSPTDEEFGIQIESQYTPNLPIDTDRYIDFIGAKGGSAPDYGYQRIDFPQLFRVNGGGLSLDETENAIKDYLDTISNQINSVIIDSKPDNQLSANESTGDFPEANIDLYTDLKSKSLEIFTLQDESKQVSYFDTLVFSVYWNSLNNVSSKYKFIFQEYLSNQFEGNDYNFILPKSKKSYEIAYFSAPGDAQNMYVKLDPELKGIHPYADIISGFIQINSTVTNSNVGDSGVLTDATFKCAPPDGVSIFEWIPAVICWLTDMLPPSTSISSESCGTDHLSQEERLEISKCDSDDNNNGVNDCLEEKLVGGSLQLFSDSGRYYYFTTGTIVSETLTNTGEPANFDNGSYVSHRLSKLTIPLNPDAVFDSNNSKLIYDITNPDLSTQEAFENAQNYISYNEANIRSIRGKTKTYFYAKGNDADAVFEAKLIVNDSQGNPTIELESNNLEVGIRGDRLLIGAYKVGNDARYSVDSTIVAGSESNICAVDANNVSLGEAILQADSLSQAKEKLLLLFQNYSKSGNTLNLNYPLSIELLRGGERVFLQENISKSQLSSVYDLINVSISGRYEIHIRDSEDFHSYRVFDILPDSATKIETTLGTNIAETGGNISTHLISVYDRYGNIASGEIYTISASLQGQGLLFTDNQSDFIEYQIIDGYKAVRLTSTNTPDENTLNIEVRNASGTLIEKTSHQIETLKNIYPTISLQGINPKVGGGEYKYAVDIRDEDGDVLTNLDSRLYAKISGLYGNFKDAYVDVENGKAELTLMTSTLSGKDINIEIQLEGGVNIYHKEISILPDDPVKVDISLSKEKIEASATDYSILETTLKDRYNNDVFTDSSTEIILEINSKSTGIISGDATTKKSKNGKTQFKISGTEIPGLGYFSVDTKPSLSENSFDVLGQSSFEKERLTIPSFVSANGDLTELGSKFFSLSGDDSFVSKYYDKNLLESSGDYETLPGPLKIRLSDFWEETNILSISGYGKNAGSIQSFFFWDVEDVQGKSYNSIYTMMLGANYGDFTQENYLAGGPLFDRDNSALAVSSLLNTPYKFHDVIYLEDNGKITGLLSSDLSQDIDLISSVDSDGRVVVDIYNNALETYIGKGYYNFSEKTNIDVSVLSEEAIVKESRGGLEIVTTNNSTLLKISNEGRLELKNNSFIEINTSNTSPGLHLYVKNGANIIATISFIGDFNTNVTRDENILQSKLDILDDTIILYLNSNRYSVRKGSSDEQNISIYYQDPFSSQYSLDDFHLNDVSGIESTISEAGIGWENSNTSLLSFSSGESVGESSKNFHSFSLVNLGDPVASLKPLDNKFPGSSELRHFDSTVGTLIESKDTLIGYELLDYNADGLEDVVTVHRNGYISLYEKYGNGGNYIYQRDLVYAEDGGATRLITSGDFTGDGYDDIFFVSESGKPELFNNSEKDFKRFDISGSISLSGSIIQVESFDMDNDKKDDIITLDDSGQIHIFYGGGTSEKPDYTKKFIGDGYAIELSNSEINNGGGIYFDGLVQLSDDKASQILLHSEQYLQELENIENSGTTNVNPEFIDESLVDNFLYISLPYSPKGLLDNRNNGEILAKAFSSELDDNSQASNETRESVKNFINNYDSYISNDGFENLEETKSYFLRSQYVDNEGLVIKKTFTDTSPEYLQSGDRVYFDISIKNTSSVKKENVAYVDNIPEYFQFENNNFTVVSQDNLELERNAGLNNYNILLDGFSLEAGEEVKVRYELRALPFSYGFLQVGLYEQGELGDDVYGDIILKENEKNCGNEADIYRSTDVRSYQSGTTSPECKESDIELGNSYLDIEDLDGDGVPDYINKLLLSAQSTGDSDGSSEIPQDDLNTIQDYSEEIMKELGLDTDGDGIPDSEDRMDNTDSGTDFMGTLGDINESIDDIADDIDELIQGLSCGFGGGSCKTTLLNWAPFAPGNDPTLLGMPIGDGLKVSEGVPIFSALTGLPVYGPWGCVEVPTVYTPPGIYPLSSNALDGVCNGVQGAGGYLGTNSSTNFVRIFATPTLTGGFGLAVCFGGPASVAGNSNPRGLHPLVPGGNCIVTVKPIESCDGGEGDPGILGYPYAGKDFGILNANCDGDTSTDLVSPMKIEADFIAEYLEYQKTGVKPDGLYDSYNTMVSEISKQGGSNFILPTQPLINIGGGGSVSMGGVVEIDPSRIFTGNGDVVDIQNTRVAAFPGFLMDWVERQLSEITTKLTNLPKVTVILPDFGGIFDTSFGELSDGLFDAYSDGKNEASAARSRTQSSIDTLKAQKSSMDCSGDDALACKAIDLKIISAQGQQYGNAGKETISGIREVYEFMGNIPLLNIETQVISVNVPWMEQVEYNRFLLDWKTTLEQWKKEYEDKSQAWSLGYTCSGTPAQIERCEQENEIKKRVSLESRELIRSLETNIQTIEQYKELPNELAKLINIKQVWIEQILCNVEAISKLMGDWISKNGERFKAWVEWFILIKAILQSWQKFIDVFAGYEAECYECKNERQDLQGFMFQLISVAIPSAPIIQFPKWPDIILDMHHVRAGITVELPDFRIDKRPLVLPILPDLQLPDAPSANFSVPALPILPTVEIPELPELASLPTVELPVLPPPPKIPQLFGAVEGMLNIIKLITKAMCFLKQSPFVPEWRAGDQIAFLTERNGYLPTDFINQQAPTISYSAISAIKITSYINLEDDMSFLIDSIRTILAPFDDKTNNIVNSWNTTISDLDQISSGTFDLRSSDQNFINQMFEGIDTTQLDVEINYEIPTHEFLEGVGIDLDSIPETIQLDIPLKEFMDDNGLPIFSDTNVDVSSFYGPLDENPESILAIVGMFSAKFIELITYMGDNSHQTMSNREFISYVNSGLSSTSFTSNHRTSEIRSIWQELESIKYTKEQDFIDELREKNLNKFNAFEDILRNEIEYSKKQQESLEYPDAPEKFIQTSTSKTNRFAQYDEILEPYNIDTLDAAIALVSGESKETQQLKTEIQSQGDEFINRVKGGLTAYQNGALLSAVSGDTLESNAIGGVCQGTGAAEYVYEGIYVLQDNKNYRLFDYVDDLKGNEEIDLVDTDNDGDDDVFYLTNGKLYFKENRKNSVDKKYFSLPPLIVSTSNNTYYNGDEYQESINGFKEASVSDGYMNVIFNKPTNSALKNFRLRYNTIIDRYLDDSDTYTPVGVDTHIVDSVVDIDDIEIISTSDDYSITEHIATLTYAGAIRGATLTTEKLVNLKTDLESGNLVTLTSNTNIYSDSGGFSLTYRVGNADEITVDVARYKTLSFSKPVELLALSGDAYVSLGINIDIVDADIIDYIGMPLLPGSHIKYDGNKDLLGSDDHIDIRYYDGAELFLDMRDITSYTLYDLGDSSKSDYTIRQEIDNDFYYARIQSFSEDVVSTNSHQILLSPQTQADKIAPQIGLNQKIRIPVYQSQEVDLTPYIYEDSGLGGISDIWVDFDLSLDGDEDGNPANDRDTENISITQTPVKISITFGPYESIFQRDIIIALVDDNGNVATKKIGFEVYPPVPSITGVDDTIITGVIDEDLLDEPVRLYRYRGGVIEKLQSADGEDVIVTDDIGNYDFETSSNTDGLELTYSGSVIANIDEYTGRVDIVDPFVTTRVLATNNPDNTSVYPEILVTRLGQTVFKQFLKVPESQVKQVSSLDSATDTGIYMKLINAEEYGSFSIPLGVAYNPGSLSVYSQSDANKIPIMTLFSDGRIELNRTLYRLKYTSYGEYAGFKLQKLSDNSDVADILFKTNASYILR